MATIISVVSQKGGTGKTVTTYNIAAAISKKGFRVLCIDLDAQCNLSTTFGYMPNDNEDTVCDALFRVCSGRTYDPHRIIHSSEIGVDYVPSSLMLETMTSQLESCSEKNNVLNKLFCCLKDEYDYILIDNSASMNIITANSLHMSDYALIVVESGIYSFDGLSDVTKSIEALRLSSNGRIKILGIIHNKATRSKVSKEISDAIEEVFGSLLFETKIPCRQAMVEQSIARQMPCVDIKRNTLAEYYNALADELTAKVRTA